MPSELGDRDASLAQAIVRDAEGVMEALSVRDAVLWADRMDGMVTLYLYDVDAGKAPDDEPGDS